MFNLSGARPAPRSHMPALIGTAVIVIAAPVFLLAHWRLASWAIAAGLWVGGQVIVLVVRQLPLGMGSLAASGAAALGRMFRAVGVMAVLIIVTVSDSHLGLPAVAVYVVAYTAEFGSSIVTYFGGEGGT
jgi:hypothetical protein